MYFYKVFYTNDEDYPVDAIVISHKEKFHKEEFDKMVEEAMDKIHRLNTEFISNYLIVNYGFSLLNIEVTNDLYPR